MALRGTDMTSNKTEQLTSFGQQRKEESAFQWEDFEQYYSWPVENQDQEYDLLHPKSEAVI